MDKKHILDEIRRTAEENNSVPLGVGRFYNETGIKESDWRGKYWTKWGDAVQEAGYKPNTLQGAYSNEFLFVKLIELIRRLGKFPTTAELSITARHDDSFPCRKVFGRFGGKNELITRTIAYCKKHVGYDDIITLCSPLYKDQDNDKTENQRDNKVEIGFVYLLKSGRHYKIGRSVSAERRKRELDIQLPEKATKVHIIKTDDPIGIEAYWHNRFKDRRKNGEWFELSSADVKAFRRRKFM